MQPISTSGSPFASPSYFDPRPANVPPVRTNPGLAYDEVRRQTVLFGGWNGTANLADTWVWDGNNWAQKAPATTPPARSYAQMAWSPALGKVVLFGGYGNAGDLNDTWTFDGTTWAQLSPATRPSIREGAAFAYQINISKLVLFGGWSDATGGYVNDTWTFDGTNWARLSPATSPSARGYARAAFDARNTKLVLFGGFNGSVDVSDTWTFDGSTWALQAPATVPAARNQYAMAYNPTLGSVIMYGGASGSVFLDDTWLWNGSNWQPSSTILHPSARRGAAFAVSPASGQLVLIGGDAPGVIYSATQLFEYPLLGEQGYYTLDTKTLNDRMHLHVNVATGNLVVDANDASVRGTGLALNVGRSYNGLSGSALDVGNSWNLGLGGDVYWSALPNGSVVILGLFGGRPVYFAKNATGYTTPPGVNADLVNDSAAATLTLTFRQSQERYVFEYPGGRLLRHVDRNNNTVSFAYATGTQLSSITDTQGRSVAFTYNTAGNIASFKDAAGRTVSYGYDANNNLTTLTDAAGKVTNFGYDATLSLTKITDPAGRITTIGYDSYLRVTSLTRVTDTTAMTGPTTKYAYKPGQTVITDPNGRATTYTENLTGHVTKVVDPLGRQRARTYTPNSDVATYNGNTTSAVYNLTYDTNNNLTQLQSPATASGQTRASTYLLRPEKVRAKEGPDLRLRISAVLAIRPERRHDGSNLPLRKRLEPSCCER